MNREEIKELVPHREPMLLVDDAEIVEDGTCVSHYTIPQDAFFVQGHFPGNPIVPGVILCEIMAQGSVLLMKDSMHDHMALYTGLDHVKFRKPVHPGDTVTVKSRLTTSHPPLICVDSAVYLNDKVCCSGTLSLMLTPKE